MKLFNVNFESVPDLKFDIFIEDFFGKLDHSGISYSVIGYYALSYYSSDFRRSKDLDILFWYRDSTVVRKFFKKNYPHLKVTKKDKSQYLVDLPTNTRDITDLDLLFESSDEVSDIIHFSSDRARIFGVWMNIPTAELLGVLICYGILFGKDKEFLNRKILDFGYLSKSSAFNKKEFFRIVKSSYPDLLEIFNKDRTLRVKSTETRKFYTWTEQQELRTRRKRGFQK